jgi:predicted aspartyl protease
MIDETMKMPEPIIEPATSIVESSNPRPRMNLPLVGSDVGDMRGVGASRAELIISRPCGATPKSNTSRHEASVLFSAPVSSRLVHLTQKTIVAVALAAALAPQLNAAPNDGLRYQALPLTRSPQNHLLVRAEINGKPATLVVDTGAPISALATDRAKYFGVASVRPRSNLPALLNINGVDNRIAITRNIQLGALNLVEEPLVLINFATGNHARSDRESDGILGTDVLIPLKAVIDYDRMLLVLKIDPTIPGPVPGFDFRGFSRVRMHESAGSNLYVSGTINGTKATLMVDTGAPGTLLHSPFVALMKIPTEKTQFRSVGVNLSESRLHLANITRLSVGSMNLRSHRVGVTNLSGIIHHGLNETPPVVGLLGSQMLHDYHAIIDLGTKSLYLRD